MTRQSTASPTFLTESRAVSKRFGHFDAVVDVSMSVAGGEVVGLLGANGAGKTTLIRILLGLIGASEGEALLMGAPPSREQRSSIGYVPQSLGLYDDLTVKENLDFTASAYSQARPSVPADLADHADTLVGDLALGTQRRLAFACALLHRPALLVLDEPTSGVDPLSRARLWDTIHQQADTGVGVLVTTHYMQEAQQCHRLLLMSGGRLVAQGSEQDVIGGTTAVEISTDDWAAAFSALERAGEAVTLDGTDVRVADGDAHQLQLVLEAAGVPAQIRSVPATIEERMTVLARAERVSSTPTTS
ncbi:MAG TPA: ABC transporter ATP-binding protein [Actinomycetes bacterium]|nr:ABC transporter ATP-binding protein [Actinomycetes bacterium]